MPVSFDARLAVEKRARVTRAYGCASCGYHAEIDLVALVRGHPEGPLARRFDRIQAENDERAYAALADELQRALTIVPCPRCGARSDSASLYRQNTILAVIGWVCAGIGMGLFQGLPATEGRHIPASAIGAFAFWTVAGAALAGLTWHRRRLRLARAAEMLPGDDGAAESKRERRWGLHDIFRWGAPHPREGSHVFRSREEMARVWEEHGGEPGSMPEVDFDQHMVAAIFEAEGSHKVARAIQHVIPRGKKLYVIFARQVRPWPMKNPASLMRVPRAQGTPVFLDVESPEAKDLLRYVTD
jgi:hypothetical protein